MTEYIEREKALSFPLANEQYDHVHADPHFIAGCETYKEWLSIIPAADVVERRVGHWMFHPEQKNIYGGKLIECSECRTQYLVMNVVEEIYCRHCGSKNQDGGRDDV